MKKIGKFNLISESVCKLKGCNCGWNITIGGKDKKDLQDLKRYLRGEPLKIEQYKLEKFKIKNEK